MEASQRILVVDDERLSRSTTARQLREAGYEAEDAEGAYQALDLMKISKWDVVLTDLRMPSMNGLEFLGTIRKSYPDIDVILMTAYGSVETAVEAMHNGAADYLTKPFSFGELNLRLHKLAELRQARTELHSLKSLIDGGCGRCGQCGLVGHSPAMAQICDLVRTFARHDAPVLITGDTGTGKEMVSRALHSLGARTHAPFIPVSCGTIPRELAESELFGHEKGSFTGAMQRRKGSFERADGGTLLLDDVDDLSPEIQAKLLRVLQEGTLFRVGGDEEITVNVRVIATTKIELENAAREGSFREDLFYRLRGLEIHIPPLRERGDDVLLVAQHFLRFQALQDGHDEKTLSPDAAAALRRYRWPGNVRELRRAIESSSILCPGDEILLEHLPAYVTRDSGDDDAAPNFMLNFNECTAVNFKEMINDFEDSLINWAMLKANGRQSKAADLLGLPRTTFQSKIGRSKE